MSLIANGHTSADGAPVPGLTILGGRGSRLKCHCAVPFAVEGVVLSPARDLPFPVFVSLSCLLSHIKE